MKYVHLLTENSLVKVGVLQKIFRQLAIGVYPYNGVNRAGTMHPLNKALSVLDEISHNRAMKTVTTKCFINNCDCLEEVEFGPNQSSVL